MTKHRQKIGHQERALLEDICLGDVMYGFLTSAGSTKLFYKQMNRRAEMRIEAEEKRRIKQRLESLERKNLVRFETDGQQKWAVLTPRGKKQLGDFEVIRAVGNKKRGKWDGKWRIVSFDIPAEHHQYRRGLRKLLLLCDFRQLEQSVYVSPYFVQELYDYLQENQVLGGYVHFFEGHYMGDDTQLRKTFGL